MTTTYPVTPADLSITQLVRNPNNREPVVDDLFVESIRTVGVLQPIRVRRTLADDTFEIEDGERRWVAASIAERLSVPCLIVEDDDRDAVIARLVGNLHRKDFEPLELASVFAELRAFGMTQTEIAAAAGCEQPWVSRVLSLLQCAPEVREQLARGEITMNEARATLRPARAPETEGEAPAREDGVPDAADSLPPTTGEASSPPEDLGDQSGTADEEAGHTAPVEPAAGSEGGGDDPVPSPAPDQDPASGTAVAPGDVQEAGAERAPASASDVWEPVDTWQLLIVGTENPDFFTIRDYLTQRFDGRVAQRYENGRPIFTITAEVLS